MDKHKMIALPVRVPNNDYCWYEDSICTYFTNRGGHPTCDLAVGILERDPDLWWVKKPSSCLELEEIK